MAEEIQETVADETVEAPKKWKGKVKKPISERNKAKKRKANTLRAAVAGDNTGNIKYEDILLAAGEVNDGIIKHKKLMEDIMAERKADFENDPKMMAVAQGTIKTLLQITESLITTIAPLQVLVDGKPKLNEHNIPIFKTGTLAKATDAEIEVALTVDAGILDLNKSLVTLVEASLTSVLSGFNPTEDDDFTAEDVKETIQDIEDMVAVTDDGKQ